MSERMPLLVTPAERDYLLRILHRKNVGAGIAQVIQTPDAVTFYVPPYRGDGGGGAGSGLSMAIATSLYRDESDEELGYAWGCKALDENWQPTGEEYIVYPWLNPWDDDLGMCYPPILAGSFVFHTVAPISLPLAAGGSVSAYLANGPFGTVCWGSPLWTKRGPKLHGPGRVMLPGSPPTPKPGQFRPSPGAVQRG